jgi:hypothetical protein
MPPTAKQELVCHPVPALENHPPAIKETASSAVHSQNIVDETKVGLRGPHLIDIQQEPTPDNPFRKARSKAGSSQQRTQP